MKKFEYVRIILYIVGILFLIMVAIGKVNIPCFWKENFNIICPSCGITRATKCALTLKFRDALQYHLLYTGIIFPFLILLWVNDIYVITKRRITGKADFSYIEIVCGYAKK